MMDNGEYSMENHEVVPNIGFCFGDFTFTGGHLKD